MHALAHPKINWNYSSETTILDENKKGSHLSMYEI